MEGKHGDHKKTSVKLLLSGGISGATARTIVAPLYRVTILFQVSSMQAAKIPDAYQKSIWTTLKEIWKLEGPLGFFKGNGAHLVKKVPFSATKFWSFEFYKKALKEFNNSEFMNRFFAGGMAASTGVVLTYPLDLAQTQLTVQIMQKKYSGIFGTLKTIFREEGFRQLYRGLLMTLMSVVPYMSLSMGLWENLKLWVAKKRGRTAPSLVESSLCGAISGACASTITFPLDLLRKHIQLNRVIEGSDVHYNGYQDAIRKIYGKHGIRGFYRGIAPHYLTVVPTLGISMGVYDMMRYVLSAE